MVDQSAEADSYFVPERWWPGSFATSATWTVGARPAQRTTA
jgi:alkanesulfonate monooxygenase SsuD/methylene tetrahydromethanopterin reductase-like flavin-dependent oxidoreductase (luciferase family)